MIYSVFKGALPVKFSYLIYKNVKHDTNYKKYKILQFYRAWAQLYSFVSSVVYAGSTETSSTIELTIDIL